MRRSASARRSAPTCRRPGRSRRRRQGAGRRSRGRGRPRSARPPAPRQAVEARRERLLQVRWDGLHAASRAALEKQARHLLDEQRHAPVTFSLTPLSAPPESAWRAEISTDLRGDFRAIERAERDHAVRERRLQAGETRTRRADEEQRRCAPRSASAARVARGLRPNQREKGKACRLS